MLQPNYNPATGRVELVGDAEASITMTATVPIAHAGCNHLTFPYDPPRVETSNCNAHFSEGHLEDTLKLRVQPTPGCNSYTSLMEFKPFNSPTVGGSMWKNYVPSNITVRM